MLALVLFRLGYYLFVNKEEYQELPIFLFKLCWFFLLALFCLDTTQQLQFLICAACIRFVFLLLPL